MSTTTTASTRAGSSSAGRAWGPLCLLCVLGALGGLACSEKAADGKVHLAQAEDALSGAGLKSGTLKDADPGPFSAQKCVQGTVDGVEAVLCEYGSDDAVTQGKAASEQWVAQAPTGAALANGRVVLAMADRTRADPNGKTIHRVTHAFLGIK